MTMKANASAKLGVRVRCEKCQNIYDYDEVLNEEVTDSSKSAEDLVAECERRIKNRMTASVQGSSLTELNVKKCPKCKHIQSWMKAAQEEGRIGNIAVISGILAIVSTIIVYNIGGTFTKGLWNWLLIPFAILLGILYFILLKKLYSLVKKKFKHQQVLPTSDGPLEVKIKSVSEVTVWKEEVY